MPWQELIDIIRLFYPNNEGPGRPARPLIGMLKLYFLQIWCALSESVTQELMHDSHVVQQFVALGLRKDASRAETTIFWQLLEDCR